MIIGEEFVKMTQETVAITRILLNSAKNLDYNWNNDDYNGRICKNDSKNQPIMFIKQCENSRLQLKQPWQYGKNL